MRCGRSILSCNAPFRLLLRAALSTWVLMIAILASGCAFVQGNYDDDFNQEQVAAIKVGISTRQDVAGILGAPERVIEVNDQEIFHYYNYTLKSGTVLFFSRTNIVGNDLYVFFSLDGIAQQVILGHQKPPPKLQFWPFGD